LGHVVVVSDLRVGCDVRLAHAPIVRTPSHCHLTFVKRHVSTGRAVDPNPRRPTMAVQTRFPVQMEDVFPQGAYMIGEVTAAEDFDRKRAGEVDPQVRDKVSGQRVWQGRSEERRVGRGRGTAWSPSTATW